MIVTLFLLIQRVLFFFFFFFNDTATTEIYTLSLHDALPIWAMVEGVEGIRQVEAAVVERQVGTVIQHRSEEHTSELQSQSNLVCRLLLEKKKIKIYTRTSYHINES